MFFIFTSSALQATHASRPELIARVQQLAPEQDEKFWEQITDMIEGHQNVDINWTIRTFEGVPQTERDKFVDKVKIIGKMFPNCDNDVIICELKRIPQPERTDEFINQVSLIASKYPYVNFQGIIFILKHKGEYTDELLYQVNAMVRGRPYPDVEYIINAFKDVPQDELTENFVVQVQTMVHQRNINSTFRSIIALFREIPQIERKKFSEQIRAIVEGSIDVSPDCFFLVMSVFTKIPEVDRTDDLVNQIKAISEGYKAINSFISNLMVNQYRLVPATQRSRACNQFMLDFPVAQRSAANAENAKQRLRILCETPEGQPFPALQVIADGQDISVVGQEALTSQRSKITAAYEAVKRSHEKEIATISALSFEEQSSQFKAMEEYLRQWMERKKAAWALPKDSQLTQEQKEVLQDKFNFKFDTAERCLQLIEGVPGIEHHAISPAAQYQTYHYDRMLNIMQLYLVAFNASKKDPVKFVESWLAERPGVVGANPDTIGQYIQEHGAEIQEWSKVVSGEHGTVPEWRGQAFINMQKAYWNAQEFMPIIEALFTTMRGHNVGLETQNELNKPACAEGAYLNVIKAVTEVLHDDAAFQQLAGVQIVNCGTPSQ